jgi:hypothetical protein
VRKSCGSTTILHSTSVSLTERSENNTDKLPFDFHAPERQAAYEWLDGLLK